MHHIELEPDDLNLFCPVTGQRILGPDHFEPSRATAFVFVHEVDEFEHITERFERIDSQVNSDEVMEEDPWDRFERFCKAVENEQTLVIFSITTYGMACGPISSTVHIGIEMNWCENAESESA